MNYQDLIEAVPKGLKMQEEINVNLLTTELCPWMLFAVLKPEYFSLRRAVVGHAMSSDGAVNPGAPQWGYEVYIYPRSILEWNEEVFWAQATSAGSFGSLGVKCSN